MKHSSVIRSFVLFGALALTSAACSGGDLEDEAFENGDDYALESASSAETSTEVDDALESEASASHESTSEAAGTIGELAQTLVAQQTPPGCALFCAPGTRLDPGGDCRCVPEATARGCEVILCRPGFRCVENSFGAGSCIAN